MQTLKPCKHCGTEFEGNGNTFYCSADCYTAHRKNYFKAHHEANRDRRLPRMRENEKQLRIAKGWKPAVRLSAEERHTRKLERCKRWRNQHWLERKIAIGLAVPIAQARHIIQTELRA